MAIEEESPDWGEQPDLGTARLSKRWPQSDSQRNASTCCRHIVAAITLIRVSPCQTRKAQWDSNPQPAD